MPTPSRPVLNASGRPAVRAGGRALVFDASGECAECCGGGGDPGVICCGRVPSNCGFTQSTPRWVFDWAYSATHTSSTNWLHQRSGRWYVVPSGSLSRSGTTNAAGSPAGCNAGSSFLELFSDGLRACATPPTYFEHELDGDGGIDMSYPVNTIWPVTPDPLLVASFPIPDPSPPAQIQLLEASLDMQGGFENDTVCYGSLSDPAANYDLWASCSVLARADAVSGKWFFRLNPGSYPPGTTASTRAATVSGTASVLYGSGGCASGLSCAISFTKTASNTGTGHTFSVSGTMSITARCLDVARCISGASSATDCGCGCGGECS